MSCDSELEKKNMRPLRIDITPKLRRSHKMRHFIHTYDATEISGFQNPGWFMLSPLSELLYPPA